MMVVADCFTYDTDLEWSQADDGSQSMVQGRHYFILLASVPYPPDPECCKGARGMSIGNTRQP